MTILSRPRIIAAGFIFVIVGMIAANVVYMKQEFGQSATEMLLPIAVIVIALLALRLATWVFNRLRSKNAR